MAQVLGFDKSKFVYGGFCCRCRAIIMAEDVKEVLTIFNEPYTSFDDFTLELKCPSCQAATVVDSLTIAQLMAKYPGGVYVPD